MIVGLGTDIIDIRRIASTIEKYGNRFKNKCFLSSEILRSEKRKNTNESYAKRYAAKEACAKALGTGLAKGVFWKDIEIRNNILGKPIIHLHNNAAKLLNNMHTRKLKIEVSLSDEKKYAIANVIIFFDEKD